MPDDVVWLPHKLRRGKSSSGNEIVIEVSELPFQVRLGNDQGLIRYWIFGIGDRKILAHCFSPSLARIMVESIVVRRDSITSLLHQGYELTNEPYP